MNNPVRTVAILFGRKGSEGLPGKNLHPILGRPAMMYPLLAARYSRRVDRIYVSTDDEVIAGLCRKYGAEVIERPPELCTRDALIEDAIQHAYYQVKSLLDCVPVYVAILLCNSCNIIAQRINAGVEMLDARSDFDSVITASLLNMFSPLRARRLTEDGTLQPFVRLEAIGDMEQFSCDRGSAGNTYFADGGMTVVRGRCLEDVKQNILPFRWMGRRICMIEQMPGGSDIDQPWQIPAVEFWLRQHGFSEIATPYDNG